MESHVMLGSGDTTAEIPKYFPFEVGYAALNNPVFYKDGLRWNHQVDTMLAERLFDQLAFNI